MKLRRWLTFNLVGMVGAGVQLGSLAMLSRVAPGRYLYNSALALEITLLHNFIWHTRFTWRDRRDEAMAGTRFVRFHLSNGAVSLFGNLAMMKVLVGCARLPVIAANTIAICGCSVLNYHLSNCWSFAIRAQTESGRSESVR